MHGCVPTAFRRREARLGSAPSPLDVADTMSQPDMQALAWVVGPGCAPPPPWPGQKELSFGCWSCGRRRRRSVSRCQQALGTVSSWPRVLGTQTFSSDQGTDNVEQKCHGLQPCDAAENKRRGQGSSRPNPAVPFAFLALQDKQWAKEQGESSRPGTGLALACCCGFVAPSYVSRWEYLALSTLKSCFGLPPQLQHRGCTWGTQLAF